MATKGGPVRPTRVVLGLSVAIGLLLGAWQPVAAKPSGPGTHALLDVPFLPQGRLLCGGASVAMVQRYWGVPNVHAEDFEYLVDEQLGGIPTTGLLEAVRSHGWDAFALRSDRETIRYHLSRGRPLVALLRSSGNAFHYVVVTGWMGDSLVVHDPSVGPFRLRGFDRVWKDWEASDFWTLLILPSSSQETNREGRKNVAGIDVVPRRPIAEACEALVHEAVGSPNDLSTVAELLSAAAELCPEEAVVLRELAALSFRRDEWKDAAAFAERAVALDPNDEHAWSLLGASRFLDGDHEGALAAWNETGSPTLDVVSLNGLTETRQEVIYRYLALRPGTLVTTEELRRARRRIADLPTVGRSRLSFEPISGGRANLVASVTERERFEPLPSAILRNSVDALTDRVTRAVVSSPTGGGERLEAGLRWWDTRPAFWLSLEGPGLMDLPGIVTLEAQVDRQSYAFGSAEPLSESRRTARLTIGDWLSSSTKAELGVGVDLFPSQGEWIQVRGGIDHRMANDHLSLRAGASRWFSVGATRSFTEAEATLAARATLRDATWTLRGRIDVRSVTEGAPLAIWPGAGLGRARPLLLRGYPLLENGVLSGEGFGPRLLHGTIEAERTAWSAGPARVGIATFLDWASVWSSPAEPVRALSSAGLGLRLHVLGRTLRLDGATRLQAGGMVLSAGWVESW